MMAERSDHDSDPKIREEYLPQEGETQEDALRCELLILIDYAREAGMSDDLIDKTFERVLNERAQDRRQGFKVVDGRDKT